MTKDQLSWDDELPPELKNIVETKGWKSPTEAVKSYAHLEKMMGMPRLGIPDSNASPAEWEKVWQKTGRPETPEHYAPDTFATTSDPDWLRHTAFALGLNNQQAKQLAQSVEERKIELNPSEAPPKSVKEKLQSLWGDRYETESQAAKRGFRHLFSEEQEFKDLVAAVGVEPVFKLLARAGSLAVEDRLWGGGTNSVATGPLAAKAEIRKVQAEAMKNRRHPYLNVTHPDHQAAVDHMRRLFETAYTE